MLRNSCFIQFCNCDAVCAENESIAHIRNLKEEQ